MPEKNHKITISLITFLIVFLGAFITYKTFPLEKRLIHVEWTSDQNSKEIDKKANLTEIAYLKDLLQRLESEIKEQKQDIRELVKLIKGLSDEGRRSENIRPHR